MKHPAHRYSEDVIVSNQSCAVDVVNGFSAERNDDDTGIAEALHRQAKITESLEDSFVSTATSLTCDTAEVSVLTTMVPTVPPKIVLNIKKLLTVYPTRITIEQIPDLGIQERIPDHFKCT
jgi:hypothetical protein